MIIGITGTIGAGKGLAARHLKGKGFRHVSVSELLAEEAARRGMEPTRAARREIANEYRARGATALIEEALADANPYKENIVVESLHTVPEVEYVRHLGGKVVAVDAPRELRWERIQGRKDGKDSASKDAFIAEEGRQMSSADPNENNLRAAIEVADYRFENAGAERELFEKINDIVSGNA